MRILYRKIFTVDHDLKHHLPFASDEMIRLLSRAEVWYIDGTFKIIKEPFKQLFTIHTFIRQGEHAKQVPLMFCMMSGKRKRDYRAVLREVTHLMPQIPNVKKIVLDFEAAVWKAIPKVLPGVQLMGCAFHWMQCIWCKIQELGILPAYTADDATHK